GLSIVDLASGLRQPLSSTGTLAGPGAWHDGRIAVWDRVECPGDCDPLDPYVLTVRYLDPRTGADVPGPPLDPIRGVSAWLLGWQADGDAVVAVFRGHTHGTFAASLTDYAETVGLFAYHPSGGRTELVRLPADANRIEIARDLLEQDHFGAP